MQCHVYCLSPRHERYLGTWADDVRCGPGMVVTSAGTYCEAVFTNGAISVSLHFSLIVNPCQRPEISFFVDFSLEMMGLS